MSGDPKDDAAKLDALDAFVMDQIINSPPDDARANADPDASRIVRSAVANAKTIIGKRRMAAAKAELAAATASAPVVPIDIAKTRRRLEALVQGGGVHGQRLTLAARSAKGGIDADEEGILEDLNELLDGNPEEGP
ncbi:hypothetical protein MKK75_09085 [Methylobacterium sp. J-030]|uniref:hypothetical protein n=1 Tax=Methylobacterium sp. J-030 TaxID=2836627 RepID=UPI001FBA57E5|nr:hypothetical protein [Methylobacterium sp. J-030]MCJ2068954.1 hypothetical protein [Methylobacterium sp. J-030]